MERLEISKLFSSYEELGGKEITVCGWIKTLRDSKAIGFMEINDGSCFKSLQVVFESTKVENYKDIVKLNVGAAVRVTGTFILTPQAISRSSSTLLQLRSRVSRLPIIRFRKSATLSNI